MVSYKDCLPAPRPVLGSDATTRFVERRGTAYLPSCSGGDWGWVKEVSILSPSHFMAQWSVGMGVMLAHMPGDDLKKVYKKVYLFLTTHAKWSLMANSVVTTWVHSEGVMLQPALWRDMAEHTSSFLQEGTGSGSKRSPHYLPRTWWHNGLLEWVLCWDTHHPKLT